LCAHGKPIAATDLTPPFITVGPQFDIERFKDPLPLRRASSSALKSEGLPSLPVPGARRRHDHLIASNPIEINRRDWITRVHAGQNSRMALARSSRAHVPETRRVGLEDDPGALMTNGRVERLCLGG
jgi:hypothetical protein